MNTKENSSIDKKEVILDLLREMKTENIVVLKIQQYTSVADYFIICSVDNTTQLQMTVHQLEKDLKAKGIRLLYPIKEKSLGWTVVDFGDIIVHVFMPEERELYDLEGFWSEVPKTYINY